MRFSKDISEETPRRLSGGISEEAHGVIPGWIFYGHPQRTPEELQEGHLVDFPKEVLEGFQEEVLRKLTKLVKKMSKDMQSEPSIQKLVGMLKEL